MSYTSYIYNLIPKTSYSCPYSTIDFVELHIFLIIVSNNYYNLYTDNLILEEESC